MCNNEIPKEKGMKRQTKDRWAVYGEYGGYFTNLKDARLCAKEYSKTCPDEKISIYNLEDGFYYIDYLNGKCIRDGWTRPRKKK